MILQALTDYYDRKAADPESTLAPLGFENKEIPFLIVLDANGNFRQIDDTRSGSGKKKRARPFLVPQGAKKTSGIAANLLWDTAEYVLGVDTKGVPERVKRQHNAFIQRLNELPQDDPGVYAVRAFLAAPLPEKIKVSPFWTEITEINPLISFQFGDDPYPVFQRSAVITALRKESEPSTESSDQGLCLVHGKPAAIERLHAPIKGVWGAQTSGANIVSFNLRAFESYGKEKKQGENAPVSKEAAFAYTTALNHLLGKDSTQRIQVGDASTVFWADKPCALETDFSSYFSEPPKDDPDRSTRAVESLYNSVRNGRVIVSEEKNHFFVLGLAPNAARIAVRFWLHGTVREFSERIVAHFDDLRIVHTKHEMPYLPLFRLLLSTAALGKADNIPPNLGGDMMRSILAGLPYPETLLQATIRRIRAEQKITYPRSALIKACINRRTRFSHPNDPVYKEELKVSLDPNNMNAGYRLGRLFAVLEKIQEEAHERRLNTTIRDRFYGAASSTPVTVFSNLMKLSSHHLDKLGKLNKGHKITLEKWLTEITEGLDGAIGFPSQLSIEDQGRFAIGYYQQRQAFFKKTAANNPSSTPSSTSPSIEVTGEKV